MKIDKDFNKLTFTEDEMKELRDVVEYTHVNSKKEYKTKKLFGLDVLVAK